MKRILALTTSISFPATIILIMVFYASIVEQTALAASLDYPQIPSNLELNHNDNNLVKLYPNDPGYPATLDKRVIVLRKFFEKYNSPLIEHASTFVEVADRHGIDYKILPSISCAESTCGKFLPTGSFNPFGWGVQDKYNYIGFESYDEAIVEVGRGMDEIYFSKGRTDIYSIAPVYNPVTPQHWAKNVTWFSQRIEEIENEENMKLAINQI